MRTTTSRPSRNSSCSAPHGGRRSWGTKSLRVDTSPAGTLGGASIDLEVPFGALARKIASAPTS